MEPVKRQFGRLTVEPGDFAGRGVNSPLFSLAYLALKAGGAKDWYSGLGLSLTHQGKLHFIQWHHIIPKSLLKEKGFETGEINEIANMAFITGQINRRIVIKMQASIWRTSFPNRATKRWSANAFRPRPTPVADRELSRFPANPPHDMAQRMSYRPLAWVTYRAATKSVRTGSFGGAFCGPFTNA